MIEIAMIALAGVAVLLTCAINYYETSTEKFYGSGGKADK